MSLHVQGAEILYGGQLPRERGLFLNLSIRGLLSVFVVFFFDERRTGMMGSSRYDDGGMQ